jgi:hypothetical protein
MQIMSEEISICKKQKTELDNNINIIKNHTKDNDIKKLLEAYEYLQKYIKEKDKDINEIIYNSCLEVVINSIDNIRNTTNDSRRVIIVGCDILRMLSEHKNISNSEVMSDFVNCIYNLIRKNNKNKEVLNHTIKTLLNFDTKKDYDYIIINRIQIIIDVMKNNIIVNSENKTLFLNLCMVIKNNYIINKIKEYTNICLETLLLILKANPNDEEIQELLSNMILNINIDHKIIMVNNGVDIFIANIKKYESNLNIVTYSCKILVFLLTISPDNLKENVEDIITEIIKLDCIEFLSDENKISNIRLMPHILVLIRKLCSSEENYIRIINAGYINKILQIIEKYKEKVNIVLLCLCFLKYIYYEVFAYWYTISFMSSKCKCANK